MKSIICFIFLCLAVFSRSEPNRIETFLNIPELPPTDGEVVEINLNKAFDESLHKVKYFILANDLDPMFMPDEMLQLPGLPGFRAQIQLQKGIVRKAVTIKRTGDVILRYNNRTLYFDFNLGWDNLDVFYDYTLKYLVFTRKGRFNGVFSNLKVEALGSMDLHTHELQLRFLKVSDIGKFSLSIQGHLADYLINAMTKVITFFAKTRIVREVEYHFIKSIEEKIAEMNDLQPDPMNL